MLAYQKVLQQFVTSLTRSPNVSRQALRNEVVDLKPDFIFQYLEADRRYGPPEYPTSGIFNEVSPPWLADHKAIAAIQPNQGWTETDIEYQKLRAEQTDQTRDYAKANVPGQRYSGTAAQQVQQRFSAGMFDPSVFPPTSSVPAMVANWIADDAEFARQRLGAANPNVIARYTGSSSDLNSLLANGKGAANMQALQQQLQDALAAGELFVCDYRPVLGKVRTLRTNQPWSVPVVFFAFDRRTDALTPAAIQLNDGGYWFTPADDANSWLLAKLHAASADAQWWFSGTHLFNTHTIDMVFGIAALNLISQGKLSFNHPMVVLLNPHLVKVYDINNVVYDAQTNAPGIYQKGQFCDIFLPTGRIGLYELVSALYKDYDFSANAFPAALAARGMDSESFRGSFPYRDDGQVWWSAIEFFTSKVINATYATDQDVASDEALNAWMTLVAKTFNHDGTTRFAFTPTKQALTDLMTNLTFVTTAQHTAVNNTMFDTYAFLPNGAFSMMQPPPEGPGVTDEQLYASLPDPQDSSQLMGAIYGQIGFVMAGTAHVPYLVWRNGSREFLHEMFPYDKSTQPAQYAAVEGFFDKLQDAKQTLENNQKARIDAFKKRNPNATSVPNSVAYTYLSVDAVMACIQI